MTGTGNNVHAADIIRTVLAKHSIRLEDEYVDGKDASMSTDVSLAVSEDMEWSVEEHLPEGLQSGGTANEAHEATHDGQHDPNNQTQADEKEEWRRQEQWQTLPTMTAVADAGALAEPPLLAVGKGRNTSHQFAKCKTIAPVSFLSPRGEQNFNFTEEVARWELDDVQTVNSITAMGEYIHVLSSGQSTTSLQRIAIPSWISGQQAQHTPHVRQGMVDHTNSGTAIMYCEPGLNLGSVPSALHYGAGGDRMMLTSLNAGSYHVLRPKINDHFEDQAGIVQDTRIENSAGNGLEQAGSTVSNRNAYSFELPLSFFGTHTKKMPWLEWKRRQQAGNVVHHTAPTVSAVSSGVTNGGEECGNGVVAWEGQQLLQFGVLEPEDQAAPPSSWSIHYRMHEPIQQAFPLSDTCSVVVVKGAEEGDKAGADDKAGAEAGGGTTHKRGPSQLLVVRGEGIAAPSSSTSAESSSSSVQHTANVRRLAFANTDTLNPDEIYAIHEIPHKGVYIQTTSKYLTNQRQTHVLHFLRQWSPSVASDFATDDQVIRVNSAGIRSDVGDVVGSAVIASQAPLPVRRSLDEGACCVCGVPFKPDPRVKIQCRVQLNRPS